MGTVLFFKIENIIIRTIHEIKKIEPSPIYPLSTDIEGKEAFLKLDGWNIVP
jgi:hypothetical protein